MKISILILTLFMLLSKLNAQTTISFSFPAGNGDNPQRFDNSGCALYHRFGPNPTSINGYNVRTVGGTLITFDAISYGALTLYATGNSLSDVDQDKNYYNANLSIEYPFKANKTYKIDIYGINDHTPWIDGTTKPTSYINPVLWVKLDNNPEITTSAQNKCIDSFTPVEKIVGRYSKLIADANVSIRTVTHTVKFSPLENKNALKIIYDPSPQDPSLSYDGAFRLRTVTITEVAWNDDLREDLGMYPAYLNSPTVRNTSPEYSLIDNTFYSQDERRGANYTNLNVTNNQWVANPNGAGYIIHINSTNLPSFNMSKFANVFILYNSTDDPNADGGLRGTIQLPCTFRNANYSYNFSNNDIIVSSNIAPPSLLTIRVRARNE